jgi:4-amino-4-deoxy-L-arabinose transferase-like glycosyltransferase
MRWLKSFAMASTTPSQKLRNAISPTVWWIFSAGTLLRVAFFLLGENNGGDALARVSLTAKWLEHPGFRLNFEPWLPMHFWLMGAIATLLGNPELTGRALSLVSGITSLGVLWLLAKVVYGESPATLSLLVFSLYSLHIGYSTTSSSEVPYLFFMLAGLLGFFLYRASGSWSALSAGAIALSVSAGMRYEAWVCIFALFLILLFFPSCHLAGGFWQLGHVREVFVFGALAGAWLLFWMIYQWKAFGKPLYGVTMNYSWVAQQAQIEHHSMIYNLALLPGVILVTLTPLVVAAGLYGLALGFRRPLGREYATVLLIMAAILAYQIISGGLLPMARYTITVGTLLVIASGRGLERMAQRVPQRKQPQLRAAFALLLVLNLGAILTLSEMRQPFSDKFSAISPRLRFPRHVEDLRQYLKPQLKPNDAIAIDDYNTEPNIIAAALGLPLIERDNTFLASIRPLSELPEYMKTQHPLYVIYSDKGVLRNSLPLPQDCGAPATAIKGMGFKCLFANETYRVYRVSYRKDYIRDHSKYQKALNRKNSSPTISSSRRHLPSVPPA